MNAKIVEAKTGRVFLRSRQEAVEWTIHLSTAVWFFGNPGRRQRDCVAWLALGFVVKRFQRKDARHPCAHGQKCRREYRIDQRYVTGQSVHFAYYVE